MVADLRSQFKQSLMDKFDSDPNAIVLVLDCGFLDLEELREKYPERVINTGVREQATVSMAAGMASEGMTPFVYSIAAFLMFRAMEQIRIDVVHTGLPVKLIGVGAGDIKFAKLGKAHCTGTLDLDICEGLELPYFEGHEVKEWMTHKGPSYLRLT